jgi:hypothetical protein
MVKKIAFCFSPTHAYELLQGLTWFSATQTGCRWLISYIEQKKFLACEPEFSVDFSAPPEFSGGVMEKCLSTGLARTFDLQIMNQVFYHCATAALYIRCNDIQSVPCWDFPAVSVVTRSRIFRPYLQLLAAEFSGHIRKLLAGIFRPYLQLLAAEFSGPICSYLQGFSGLTFSGTRRPGFSGRICCF